MREPAGPTPGAPEKAAVRTMFDRIAPRYDLLNRLLSAGIDARWRRRCIDAAGPASRVLDVCSGTGDLLIEFLRRDQGRSGLGVDLSTEMLVRGAAKLRGQGMADRGHMAAGDAERLPLAARAVDAVTVAFGIRNVGEPLVALREMLRVLRPGGRAVILEFSMPQGTLGVAYRLYFTHVLPRIGGWISGDAGAYAYLPASVARFARPAEFGALMTEAGFARVSWRSLTAGVAHLYIGERNG
jgi:demethylmenaquinone methyltransferase/2-methoxy-6-polyprenyl-1,4-benzoquinol methylase